MREKEERNVSNLRHCKDFSVSATTLPCTQAIGTRKIVSVVIPRKVVRLWLRNH